MATVFGLRYYPIKGCAGISVSHAVLTPAGLRHDRTFMVVGEDGVFRSQRRDPRLAVIRPQISPGGERLTLRAPGVSMLCVDVDLTAALREVVMFGTPYTGIDQGDVVAGWLSAVLGAPSRLVRVPLDLLNERIAERGGQPVPMNRFRPNIVVAGWAEPHLEDRARRIDIAGAELGYAKLAIRCGVTMVDQESGMRAGPEPLRTLADYRRGSEGVVFGAKFAVMRAGKLAVGDELLVSRWGESTL